MASLTCDSPVLAKGIQRDDLLWLAGYMEGEGSFFSPRRRDDSGQIRMTVGTTDQDVATHVARLLNVWVCGPTLRPPHKPCYKVYAHGALAAGWMMMLYPFLGQRRKSQVQEALRAWRAHPLDPRVLTRVWRGKNGGPHPPRSQ